MKKIISIFTLIILCSISYGQDQKEEFTIVENMPIFKGCEKKKTQSKRDQCTNVELYKFIVKNVRYPKDLFGQGLSGTTYVTFRVDTTGKVIDERIEGKFPGESGYKFDEEALKVVRQIPTMTPGMTKGEPQAVQYTIPVRFSEK
ncbi:MAG: energy transducer TonB [Bacteroidetes bacterium]|nr:MAG: energy transducer TonB [Bacteroidota bacterium]MBL1145950.1 energy transducer TonB [Bacteroidota bacterium]MCB0803338.1 energy transducer TonB [Flavobacteriales bacterium]NOG58744.1 energy transducer TonB [Bacteroidota bacterium]